MALLTALRGSARRLIDGVAGIAATRLEIAALEVEAQVRALTRLWWLASLAMLLGLAALALCCVALLLAVDAGRRPAVAAGLSAICLVLGLACAAHARAAARRPWLATALRTALQPWPERRQAPAAGQDESG